MTILCVDPVTDASWRQLIEKHPKSCVFHTPDWAQVLTDTYGFRVEACIEVDSSSQVQAGVHFCHLQDMRGERIVSLPFSDFCDPLVDNLEQWQRLAEYLLTRFCCTTTVRCLHQQAPLDDERFDVVKEARWHGLDLRPEIGCLWNGLHSSARRAIRKAQQDGVEVHCASQSDLREFYDLHLGIRKYKYHMLAQPYTFFENIWHQFVDKGTGFLLIAVFRGAIIGGAAFLKWRDTLTYKFSATNPDFQAHRPTDLLIWEGIQLAKSLNCKDIDFGLSDDDQDGLIRFKRKFATQEKSISFLSCSPTSGTTAQEEQARNLFPRLTSLFTNRAVPDRITEQAGDLLYRFFA
jgi:hypothetical protein